MKNSNSLVSRIIVNTRRLDHVIRCSLMPVVRHQNVSEHSFHVGFMSLLAAEDMKNNGVVFSELTLIKLCLCHDVEEGMVGDIVYPTKNANQNMKDALTETIENAWGEMSKGTTHSAPAARLHGFLRFCETENTLEFRVMKCLDMLEFMIYQAQEMAVGNRANFEKYDAARHITRLLLDKLSEEGCVLQSIFEVWNEYSNA